MRMTETKKTKNWSQRIATFSSLVLMGSFASHENLLAVEIGDIPQTKNKSCIVPQLTGIEQGKISREISKDIVEVVENPSREWVSSELMETNVPREVSQIARTVEHLLTSSAGLNRNVDDLTEMVQKVDNSVCFLKTNQEQEFSVINKKLDTANENMTVLNSKIDVLMEHLKAFFASGKSGVVPPSVVPSPSLRPYPSTSAYPIPTERESNVSPNLSHQTSTPPPPPPTTNVPSLSLSHVSPLSSTPTVVNISEVPKSVIESQSYFHRLVEYMQSVTSVWAAFNDGFEEIPPILTMEKEEKFKGWRKGQYRNFYIYKIIWEEIENRAAKDGVAKSTILRNLQESQGDRSVLQVSSSIAANRPKSKKRKAEFRDTEEKNNVL